MDYLPKSSTNGAPVAEKEEKNIQQITKGTVKKKKSLFKNFANEYLGEDPQEVKSYVVHDVIVPYIKRMITDALTTGLDMLINGEVRKPASTNTKVSYGSYYESKTPTRTRTSISTPKYEDLEFDSKGEAEAVLSELMMIAEKYESASVADLYSMVGMTPSNVDYKYGWKELGKAYTQRTFDGTYVLKLPKVITV